MLLFSFSNKKIISRNTTSYPINASDVKALSEYFRQNPSDTSLDSYITNQIIPKIIFDWEKSTGYLLLDHSIQAFVPDLQTIMGEQLNIGFEHLNIRTFSSVKYYPEDWDYSEARTAFDLSKYFIIPECARECAKLNFKQVNLPIDLFPMQNNLECNYLAGYASNSFATLPPMIKDALASQAALAVDAKTGFCQDFGLTIIGEVYAQYSINKQEVVIL
jgi:hypothetical protein